MSGTYPRIAAAIQVLVMNATDISASPLPKFWNDLFKLDTPIDFDEFLESELLADRWKFEKTVHVVHRVVGSVSFTASGAIIYHILRSHHGLSTTYHRLVFGLCFADMLSSFAFTISSSATPKEMNYFIPHAIGRVWTCDAQGFLVAIGIIGGAMYNSSICLYYLAIIKYNKKDEYIQKKFEPWFHGVTILLLIFIITSLLRLEAYNNWGGTCFPTPNVPPHCVGYENGFTPEGFTIPCGRGDVNNNPFGQLVMIMGFGIPMGVTPVIIVTTMVMMYRSVAKVEHNIRSYGIGSLRLSVTVPPVIYDDGNDNSHSQRCWNCFVFSKLLTSFKQCTKLRRLSNRSTSRKRAILQMVMGYSSAWVLIYIPFILAKVTPGYTTGFLVSLLSPLQGFYNLIVYMSPKVRNAKRSRRRNIHINWCQAIVRAWLFRGEARRESVRWSIRSNINTQGSRIQSGMKRLSRFGIPRHSILAKRNACAVTHKQGRSHTGSNKAGIEISSADFSHLQDLDNQEEKRESEIHDKGLNREQSDICPSDAQQ